MRARKVRRSEEEDEQHLDRDDVAAPRETKKFDPALGSKLAFTSLLSLALSSSSGLWFSLLSSQPPLVSVGLSVLHLGFAFSLGQSFLPRHFSVWAHASLLGATLTGGVLLFKHSDVCSSFGMYVIIMSVFHFGEFFATALTNPANLSTDSFLLNHSKEYWCAAVASWIEFFVEAWLVPGMKTLYLIAALGVLVCTAGDLLRKLAMFNAGRSFSHIVQSTKKADHKLITNGVYSYMRHPSYVGWFYWSVGTQLVLCNPVCSLIYALVSWRFFAGRIYIEEFTLLQFFGDDYKDYQQRVSVGIPYIQGFAEDDD